MGNIRIACQTYTWEMLGDQWRGRVTDILDRIAKAGYAGVEITNNMIGEFASRPDDFAAELDKRGLALACFAYATTGFTDLAHREDDLAGARRAIEFVRNFPEPRIGLGGAASPSRSGASDKLDRAIAFYNEVGCMAAAQGISVNVHPHSHHGSLLETAEEYRYLAGGLDGRCASLGPDTGHIVRGGQNLLACLREYLPRITHIHFKDADPSRRWVALGEGQCDFPAVVDLLRVDGYDGWIVAEEESEEARHDGVSAIRKNRQYLQSLGC